MTATTSAVFDDMSTGKEAVSRRRLATRALHGAAGFWLVMALIGQWAFFYYITAFYGTSTFTGQFEIWNRLSALGRTPYVAGDIAGNLTYAAHALAAGIVALGGAFQLMPQVRSRFPRFHRWNGRLFLLTVIGLSLSGFYLVWVRGTSPNQLNAVSTSVNGLLILALAGLALRTAMARDFVHHRRWAMRLYLVANAQWFLRVGVFGYFIVNRAFGTKVGMDDPFLQFWTFGCFLVPLAVLELYLRARDGGSTPARFAVAGTLVVATLLMTVGMGGFAIFSHMIATGAPLAFPS